MAWRWWGGSSSSTKRGTTTVAGGGTETGGDDGPRGSGKTPGGLSKLTRRLQLARGGVDGPDSLGGDTVLRILVIDAKGAPAVGATVDGSMLEGDLLEPPLPARTDTKGQALLHLALPRGGKASGMLSAVSGQLRATSEHIEATFPNNRQFAIQIELAQSSFVRGTVLLDGKPVAGARLEARGIDYPRAVAARTMSGVDGRYELVLAAPATYHLAADYLGTTGTVPSLELPEGQREQTVDVALAAHELAVVVHDPDDKPVVGVAVKNHGSDVTLAVTDELGRATVRGALVDGVVRLSFGRDGYADTEATRYPDEESSSGPMQVTMRPALELAGNILAPPDAVIALYATPVGEVVNEDDRFMIKTLRESGPFKTQVDAEDGQYTLTGYVEGVGEIPPRIIELRRGTVVDVGTLEASSVRGIMTGLVEDTDGRPLPGAEVKVQPRNGRSILTATSDGNGRFSFDLPAGSYHVAAFMGPRYLGREVVEVGAASSPVTFRTPACSKWSLPSFDRVTSDGIVVVESLTSGLQPGDRIMELNGVAATQDWETLESGEPITASVISPSGYAYEAKLTPICIW